MQDFDTAEQAVRGTDMVVSAVNSKVPVYEGEWIEKGIHLTGVLPYKFDLDCYEMADYIVTFNCLHGRDYTLSRKPEEVPPETPPHAALLKGTPEIADLVSCKVPGRRNDDQITIFAKGGHGRGLDGGPGYEYNSQQFLIAASSSTGLPVGITLVYDLAREKRVGRELPVDWFAQNVNS